MSRSLNIALAFAAAMTMGCKTASFSGGRFSHFTGITDFSNFTRSQSENGETILLSPKITSPVDWDQLVVSWNATAVAGTWLKVEASAIQPGHTTKFFSWGQWSPDNQVFPRASMSDQKDGDGNVKVDTLILNRPANAVQLRLTLGGTNGAVPSLKFLGLAFCNSKVTPATLPPNRAAWGKIIPVIERSQQSYAGGGGWCSPTSVSMALAHWGAESNRSDWKLDAPEVAAGVFDRQFKYHTGNWPFNTAFAGRLDSMRACVSRFSDISELEDWVAAGFPVVISARYDLLQDGRAEDLKGHLTICRGFTKNGDLIINDPWTDLKVESVRHVYKRENVRRAWATSHNTVYLIYPEDAKLPHDRFGHW